jgi:hypothetical protein
MIAEAAAGTIEQYTVDIAKALYGADFKVRRFSTIDWGVFVKKGLLASFVDSGSPKLFDITIANPSPLGNSWDPTKTFIFVHFLHANIETTSFDDVTAAKIIQYCQKLSTDTGLIVRVRIGVNRGLQDIHP